jgi:rfaE bifunctional protein kinase chain/domain
MNFFESIKKQNVLVIGDVMLDRYLLGQYNRLNPEAPVPLVAIESEENRLGGAANVALNLASLGMNPLLIGIINETDYEGKLFLDEMEVQNISSSWIIKSEARFTTTKIRIYAKDHYLLRYDREKNITLSNSEFRKLCEKIEEAFSHPIKAVIIEDYDKGLLNRQVIGNIIQKAIENGVPVLVDPKYSNFWEYEGVYLFKPNLKELNQALGTAIKPFEKDQLQEAIKRLRARMPHQHTLVTLSEYGMVWMDNDEKWYETEGLPIVAKDVSGAGDTVISVITATVIANLPIPKRIKLANEAGATVCIQKGVVPIRQEDLKV